MMKPDISVVVPAYNEKDAIQSLFDAINEYVSSIDFSIQFIFVDDGSQDDTFTLLKNQKIIGADKKIVKLSKNFGSHAAIRAGIYHSDANYVMIYSTDMPESIEDITLFYTELKSGIELVYSERIGYRGSFGSRVYGKLVHKFIDPTYPNTGIICIAFGNKIKQELNCKIENNSSILFQVFQLGFSRKGIPARYNERKNGESKWTFGKKIKLFIDSFVMFSYMPIRLITSIGMLMAFIGLLWAMFIVICKVFDLLEFAAGFPTTMSILLIGFGITNISLGTIAEYLVRTLDAARGRSTFIVEEII